MSRRLPFLQFLGRSLQTGQPERIILTTITQWKPGDSRCEKPQIADMVEISGRLRIRRMAGDQVLACWKGRAGMAKQIPPCSCNSCPRPMRPGLRMAPTLQFIPAPRIIKRHD